jgi:hypothetical protein
MPVANCWNQVGLALWPGPAIMPGMFLRLLALVAVLTQPLCAEPRTPDEIARQILAPLLDPAKLATLKGDRPANPRLYKALYWLETAREMGGDMSTVIGTAQAVTGSSGTPAAKADMLAIISNRTKLQVFGCLTANGMAKLRKGGSPAITKGEHSGDCIALDHILPRSVVPELAARFYNLEALPARVNLAKSDRIGQRELNLARQWNREGLLSTPGLRAVEVVVE